ncbi:MAG: hypothetical protein L0332_10155 [Chloroflexi bacterium]|nr:hypothetical protein [Chloroflexota bacterium]MCI0574914.1 hypothetical protein [Chloroflexota bacterium]MCI0647087.1 hypothetical protein [Chloroflexota bacterium]MCI0727067.1 hypothetical protein [Chloroflexota bacterium]
MRTVKGVILTIFSLAILAALLLVTAGSRPLPAAGQSLPAAGQGNPQLYLPFLFKPVAPPPAPTILTTIPLPAGSHPHGIALDIPGQRAFVANHEGNSLSILDTAAMTVLDTIALPGADGPNGVSYHPATGQVYVANRNTNNVSVVNAGAGLFVQNIPVGNMPDGVVVASDLAYVANFGSDSVSLIDVTANAVSDTLAVGLQPALLAGNDDRGFVYLSAYGDSAIDYLLNGALYNNLPGVPSPYGLAFDPITFRLYAANRGSSQSLTLIDVNPNTIAGTLVTGRETYVVGVNPRTGHLFSVLGDTVAVNDRRDNGHIVSLPIGGGSEEGIAVDPGRNLIFITNSDANTVTVLQDVLTHDIAYVAWYDSSGYIVSSDDWGQHSRALTLPAPTYGGISWRPDGKYLFYSAFNPEADVWTMESGGANQLNLTNDVAGLEDLNPAWSPDGSQIAWRRDWRIWVMDADGSNKTPLSPEGLTAREPLWSPDGQWIAFTAYVGSHEDVLIVPAAGGMPINVSDHPEVDLGVTWAAGSAALAFESNRDGNWEIYTADLTDPGNIQLDRLTNDPSNDHGAAWSGDGSQIAFLSDRETGANNYAIYLMDPDGSNQRRLTPSFTFLRPLLWSPGDHSLLVVGGYLYDSRLYKVNVATGLVDQIVPPGFSILSPAWRPDTWE